MSHFTVLVLVPQENVPEPGHPDFTHKLIDAVGTMLAPFNEGNKVTPYQAPCGCLESAVSREADKLAAKETGLTWEALREAYRAKTDEEREQIAWKDFVGPLSSVEARYREELTPDAKPDADCDECHGTGFYESRYNPLSKWDWYSIGGRWDGHLKEQGVAVISSNAAFARDVQTAAYVPFAILSPRETHQKQAHDNWSEKGQMGWFAIVANENDNWPAIANELLGKYSGCIAVLVDCHI